MYRMTGNLGVAIVLFTVLIRFVLIPVTLPTLKMSKKQREIQPELSKLKAKFKYDKKKQAELQMELMKKHGINPTAGCLTTIVTVVLTFAIYSSVRIFTYGTDKTVPQNTKNATPIVINITDLNKRVYIPNLQFQSGEKINEKFLYLNLSKPDPYLIFTILAVITQFLLTKMMMPYNELEEKAAKQTDNKEDDIMAAMQKQNLYVMPVMFLIFGLTLPSGVILYLTASSLFQIVQTWYFSGWGGLNPWIKKLKYVKKEI
jgi:YidC/Oxa1 family membrane protein insertase